MIKFLHKIIVGNVKRRLRRDKVTKKRLSEEVKNVEVGLSHFINETFFILIGVVSAGFGLKAFYYRTHLLMVVLWEFHC